MTMAAKPKTPTYEYHGEVMNEPTATVDVEAIKVRLNQLGAQGWKLVAFTGVVAWFVKGP